MQTPLDLRLARHGVIVLLLGLLTGFVIGLFHNPQIGNAAHLTGLIGGFGMIALGLLWPRLQLAPAWSAAGAWMTALSLYLSWFGLAVRGGFGSGPKGTAAAMLGSPLLWDRAGAAVLGVAALLSLVATLIVLIGLRKLAQREVGGAGASAEAAKFASR